MSFANTSRTILWKIFGVIPECTGKWY